jgi:uncharacterized protein (DUF697 family)
VGKSTLYNQLVRNVADRAEVSAVPGTTRVSQATDAGLFAIVDTPGADAVGAAERPRRNARSPPRATPAALPEHRAALAWSVTRKAAATAAVIALTPLPILDVFPLLAVQTTLVLGIARIYGQRVTLARARELVVTFGLGLAGRTLFQELSKLGGPPGWMLAAAIAASTTVVMGRAAAVWFDRGERAKASRLRAESRSPGKRLLDSLRTLGRRRPPREAVRREVEAALSQAGPGR